MTARARLIWCAALAGAALSASTGHADVAVRVSCAPWPKYRDLLRDKFNEVPIGGGVTSDGLALQVLASPDGATFSILIIGATGLACLTYQGEGWEPGTLPTGGKPS